jgi:hypothetical protein
MLDCGPAEMISVLSLKISLFCYVCLNRMASGTKNSFTQFVSNSVTLTNANTRAFLKCEISVFQRMAMKHVLSCNLKSNLLHMFQILECCIFLKKIISLSFFVF